MGGLSSYHAESSQPYAYYASHGFTSPNSLTGTCTGLCYQTFRELHGTALSSSSEWADTELSGMLRRQPARFTLTRRINGRRDCSTTFPGTCQGRRMGPLVAPANAALGKCGPGLHIHIADLKVRGCRGGRVDDLPGSWNACPGIGSARPSNRTFRNGSIGLGCWLFCPSHTDLWSKSYLGEKW